MPLHSPVPASLSLPLPLCLSHIFFLSSSQFLSLQAYTEQHPFPFRFISLPILSFSINLHLFTQIQFFQILSPHPIPSSSFSPNTMRRELISNLGTRVIFSMLALTGFNPLIRSIHCLKQKREHHQQQPPPPPPQRLLVPMTLVPNASSLGAGEYPMDPSALFPRKEQSFIFVFLLVSWRQILCNAPVTKTLQI